VKCGLWACDTYTERLPSYPEDELYVVLEGSVVVTVDGSQPEGRPARRYLDSWVADRVAPGMEAVLRAMADVGRRPLREALAEGAVGWARR
jgi:hypothetical protein